jgi:subfamily B ATP-binding cassette protein MsbA
VKVHGTQRHEISRYSRLANRMLSLNMKVETTRALASSTVQFLAALALAVIVWVSTREALAGKLNAGQFMG